MEIDRKSLGRFILSFLIGALALSSFSLFQKKLLGLPLIIEPHAFIVPILFGGFSGLAVAVANMRLRASRETLKDFVDNIGELIQIVDSQGNFLFVNRAWCETLGYTRQEVKSLSLFDVIHPDHLGTCTELFSGLISGQMEETSINAVFVSKSGKKVYLDGKANGKVKNKRIISTRTICRNVSAEQEAIAFKKIAATIFENSKEGFVVVKPDMTINYVNRAFTRIAGYTKEESMGENVHTAFPSSKNLCENRETLSKELKTKGYWEGELWNKRKDGELYPVQLKVSAIKDEAGKISHYAGIFSDRSSEKEKERHLHYLATHDSLTNLPNREMFLEFASISLAEAKATKSSFVIMFIDLDHFKNVNDQYGHLLGNQILHLAAQRLASTVRQNDMVARFGGDEFTALFKNIQSKKDAHKIAEKILDTISIPFSLEQQNIKISASIGVSMYTNHHKIEIMLNEADKAMYAAKENCRTRIQFTHPNDEQPRLLDDLA